MTVLIIGAPEEEHSAFIYQKIQARGHDVAYFDTRDFPSSLKVSLSPDQSFAGCLKIADRSPIRLSEIQSVYWRHNMGVQMPELPDSDPAVRDLVFREIESAMGGFFRTLPCRWVNTPNAIAMHVYKTQQLQLLYQAGVRIPKTLITNDPEAVLQFYEQLNGRVIYKPVRGGAHTQQLQVDDLHPDRLANLAKSPVKFQEMIDGVDIRVYWVDGNVFAAEIQSETLDFRDHPSAPVVPISLPEGVIKDCAKLAQLFDLVFTGIDIRRTPQGEYIFLEGNPSPMFIYFESQTGYPISDRLVDLLLS